MINLAIFASGAGSNARNIIEFLVHSPDVRVALVVSNRKDAGVLDIAHVHGIPTHVIDRSFFYETQEILELLKKHEIGFIVLAGFLWLVPAYFVNAFPRRILNIHPSLLPKFGGKGMYGMRVHEAVRTAGETETGMTIHFVNDQYDEGDIIFQARCPIAPEDSPADIAHHVLELEHRYFPEVIEKEVRNCLEKDHISTTSNQ